MRIAVVGGGIGGAATALALTQEGADVVLLEQAPELTEVGAGLQVNANGTRALGHLGVLERFDSLAVRALSYRISHFETGEVIHEHQIAGTSEDRFGAVSYEAHRADLLTCLVDALPEGVVRTGARVIGVAQAADGVTVTLESGEQLVADLVVGADGIHSVVRAQQFPAPETEFAGVTAWRALIPAERLAGLDLPHCFHGWRGPGRIAIGYWARAGALFNFAAFVPADELHQESWNRKGSHEDLVRAMKGAEPFLAELVDRAEDNFLSSLHRYRPLPTWVNDRVALMGDAAHAMLPYMHQGANQALEDAVVLGRLIGTVIAGEAELETALRRYDLLRRPRTSKVQADVLALETFWFADDPVHRLAGMRRMQAQDRDDPDADSQWGYVYSYDPILEAGHGDVARHPAASVSRAARLPVWPLRSTDRRWADIFDFGALAGSYRTMRTAYDAHFSSDVAARELDLGGVTALEVDRSTGPDAPVVVHVHGGGYILGSARSSLAHLDRLATAAGARAVSLDVRLAPEHPFPAAEDDLVAALAALQDDGVPLSRIVLSGEGSGAAVVLTALVRLRAAGQALPAGALLVSPFADLTLASESVATRGLADAFWTTDQLRYCSNSYSQATDPHDPVISPVFADLGGLPPLLLLGAEREALTSDALRLAVAADRAGTRVRLVLADTDTHAFPLFPDLPQARPALELMARVAVRMVTDPGASLELGAAEIALIGAITGAGA